MTPKQTRYFRKRGVMSVIDAVRIAYEEMPRKFYGSHLAVKVRRLTGRPGMSADSATRKMRLLREPKFSEINFECLSAIDSYYKKL